MSQQVIFFFFFETIIKKKKCTIFFLVEQRSRESVILRPPPPFLPFYLQKANKMVKKGVGVYGFPTLMNVEACNKISSIKKRN